MPLVYLGCAWVAGVLLGSRLGLPAALALIGLAPLSFLPFARRYRKALVLSSLTVITLFAAAAYAHSSLQVDRNDLSFYNDQGTIEIRGKVDRAPERGDKSARIYLEANAIKLDAGWREISGAALVFTPRYAPYEYGDILSVTGKLETPGQIDDFDYRGYLAHQGIYSTISYPGMTVLERGQGFAPLAWIYSLRSRLSNALAAALPEPQASLAQGILLGIRGNIPAAVKTDFYRTGTTHILAISGMNLSIVAGLLLALGIWLFGRRRHIYIWLALGIIWTYSVLTGMQPPVVRSAVMASVFLAAELAGRQRSGMVALVLAAAIMVGVSPYALGDASFQLSFLAMAGLIFVFPALRDAGRRIISARLGEHRLAPLANAASDGLAVTLAATVAVWPLVAYYFGIFSPVGPLATITILPALPAIILTSALTAALGLIFAPAALAAGWLAWPFLTYMLGAVNIMARPSFSAIELDPINPGWVWAYYIALGAVIWSTGNRKKLAAPALAAVAKTKSGGATYAALLAKTPKRWVLPPLMLAAVLVPFTAASMPDNRLHVSVLDVGEGDAILVQKGQKQVLIDGGPSPQAIGLGLGARMPFWDRTIDLMVSTHPHMDHIAGLVEVLRRYKVDQVLYPDLSYPSPVYDEWLRVVREKGIRSTIAREGQIIDLGDGAVIEIFRPDIADLAAEDRGDIDNASLVLRVRAGNFSFLSTSDITRAVEQELVRHRAGIASTVLKVAHHGSATSTSPGFLAVVSPQVAVISVGAGNRMGHPNGEVLKRLQDRLGASNVYRTDLGGAVEFISDGDRLWVKTGR